MFLSASRHLFMLPLFLELHYHGFHVCYFLHSLNVCVLKQHYLVLHILYIDDIMMPFAFLCNSFFSANIMFLKLININAYSYTVINLFFTAIWHSMVWIYQIYLSIFYTYLYCYFQFWIFTKSITMVIFKCLLEHIYKIISKINI